MNKRKTAKADVDSKRFMFVEIGLVITLALCLLAFEWKKYDIQKVDVAVRDNIEVIEEVVLQTEQEIKPPPPPTEVVQSTTLFNIVENDVEIETDIIIDVESTEDLLIEEYVPQEIEEEVVEEAEIFLVVENQPEFPGGEEGRLKYLRDNVKYPDLAKESGIQGTVYVQFVVEPDGRVSNVEVLRGIGGGCDEEAIRVVKNMPKWKPGSQRGRNVRVSYRMPIKFTLQ
jgi:protein TonB